VAPGATPLMPTSLRAASSTAETAVPWPPWSVTGRPPPVTSREAGLMRPANSAEAVSTPLSITATVTPAPV
jgi:hypothetical protein